MSENGPLYGVWFKAFRGWLCSSLGQPYSTYSTGEAVVRLLTARTAINSECVVSAVTGAAFSVTQIYDENNKDKEKLVVRSFDEWAKSEGLIE